MLSYMHIAKHGRGRDGIEVGSTTTHAISAYHYKSCEFDSRTWRGVLDTRLSVTCGSYVVFSGYSGILHP